MHNGELHNLYASPSVTTVIKSRRRRWVEYVACIGIIRNAYKIFIRKPEGKRPLRRPRYTWGDNIRMGMSGLDSSSSE
jgi:hypothetical protein